MPVIEEETQIAADGRRYATGTGPKSEEDVAANSSDHVKVYGAPADGDVPVYNAAAGRWEPGAGGGGGSMTASQILTAIKTVDGAGSGLDADLLDGQTGSYYTGYADTAAANAAAALVDSSPTTLNTLNELAAALGDDPNFATTVAGLVGDVDAALTDHLNDSAGAHAASAISVTDTGDFFTGTTVEAILAEIGDYIADTPTLNFVGKLVATPNGDDFDIDIDMSTGRSGGDEWTGGSGSGDNVVIRSTEHNDRGRIILYDQTELLGENKVSSAAAAADYNMMTVPASRTVTQEYLLGSIRAFIAAHTEVWSSTFGGHTLFQDATTVQNANGATVSLPNVYSLLSSPLIRSDGGAFTVSNVAAIGAAPVINQVSGTIAVSVLSGLSSGVTVTAGTVTNRYGLYISEAAGAGTVTNQAGIFIENMSKGASSNYAARLGKANTATLDFTGNDGTVATGIRFVDANTTIHRSASGVVTLTGKLLVTGELELDGALNHDGSTVGFYGVTPVSRPSAYTQTFSTADKTHAARTAAALSVSVGTADGTVADVGGAFNQTTLNNNFRDVADAYNALRADLADTAALVNAIIDDLQALGLFQ